ncbi:putative autocrine motility factor receptor: amfr-like protein [Dinothrombium tinctorium]|uniref:Putative autocrine motility factor receptor: amfr-like protein n=1 Tax=Dinothrombium tinctorium TaxID=1965070 RepID=A0A3S3RF43_9ACAR|nr:putative autocrine motility factor receptor: amfr-like protein [Dinothrombium tinctorium]
MKTTQFRNRALTYRRHFKLEIITISDNENEDDCGKRVEEENDCPICLDKMINEQSYRTECRHRFHKKCLYRWISKKNNCPECRNVFSNYCDVILDVYEDDYYDDIDVSEKSDQCEEAAGGENLREIGQNEGGEEEIRGSVPIIMLN